MMTRWLVLCSLLVACGKGDGKSEAKGDEIPLQEIHDDMFGVAIKVPTGAKLLDEGIKSRHTWSWSPDQNVNSYHCIIEESKGLASFTADEVRKRVELVRGKKEIKGVEASGADGFLVELAEDDLVHYRESWMFRRGKARTIVAICSGPAKGDTVTAMATSMRID